MYHGIDSCCNTHCTDYNFHDHIENSAEWISTLPKTSRYAINQYLLQIPEQYMSDYLDCSECLCCATHLMNKPTSLTTALGTPSFCVHIGNQPFASLAVAIIHSILRSGSMRHCSMLV